MNFNVLYFLVLIFKKWRKRIQILSYLFSYYYFFKIEEENSNFSFSRRIAVCIDEGHKAIALKLTPNLGKS